MNGCLPLPSIRKKTGGSGEQLKLQCQKMTLVIEQKSCYFGWLLYIIETTA